MTSILRKYSNVNRVKLIYQFVIYDKHDKNLAKT